MSDCASRVPHASPGTNLPPYALPLTRLRPDPAEKLLHPEYPIAGLAPATLIAPAVWMEELELIQLSRQVMSARPGNIVSSRWDGSPWALPTPGGLVSLRTLACGTHENNLPCQYGRPVDAV